MTTDRARSTDLPRSTFGLSRWVIGGLIAYSVASAAMLLAEIGLLYAIQAFSGELLDRWLTNLEAIEGICALAGVVAFIVTIVAYSKWKHRSYSNLVALEVDGLRYTPGWAVGSYFVPILNLVRPFRAMNDIWNGTFGRPLPDNVSLVSWWWATWIAGAVLSRISKRMTDQVETVSQLQVAIATGLVAGVVMIACAVLLTRIVTTVTAEQTSLAAQRNNPATSALT